MEAQNLRQNIITYKKTKDKKILEKLYLEFKLCIHNISKKLYCDDSENELILSFIEIIQKLDVKNYSNERLQGIIIKSLKHKRIDLIRKQIRLENKEKYLFEYFKTINNDMYDVNLNLFIEDICKTLNTNEKFIIISSFVYEKKNTEIALTLNLSEQRIGKIKKRALEKIKTFIEF